MNRKAKPYIVKFVLLIIICIIFIWIGLSSNVFQYAKINNQINYAVPVEKEETFFPVNTPSQQIYNSITPYPKSSTTTVSFLASSSTPTMKPITTSTVTATPRSQDKRVIGYSVENRPLEVFQFGQGSVHLMIVAGIHGGYEWNTVALADQLIEKLKNEPTLVPNDKTLYILRVLNPDGYEKDKGPDGRANANNVDINRNWDANWQKNWYGTHCWNYRFLTAGLEPMSEPETKALAEFILDQDIEALISYHSAALGIFPGGWPKDKTSINLANDISQVSPYSFPPVTSDCVYTGQLIDWASGHNIAALDIELRNHVDTDLLINLKVLNVFLNWSP